MPVTLQSPLTVHTSTDYSKCEITVTKGVKVFQDSLEIAQRQPMTQSSSSTATADQDPSVKSYVSKLGVLVGYHVCKEIKYSH